VALTDQNAVFAEHWEVLNCYILSAVDFQDGSLDEKEKAEIRSWSIFSASALSTIPGRPPCFYSYSIARFPNPGKHRNVSNKKVLGNQEMEFMCEKKGNLDEDSHLFNCSNCVWLELEQECVMGVSVCCGGQGVFYIQSVVLCRLISCISVFFKHHHKNC
jgi:hypothetical protein